MVGGPQKLRMTAMAGNLKKVQALVALPGDKRGDRKQGSAHGNW
jgi:hypothetical protein